MTILKNNVFLAKYLEKINKLLQPFQSDSFRKIKFSISTIFKKECFEEF